MKAIYMLVSFFIVFSCSTKPKEKSSPISIEKATYQYWHGGVKGVGGINIAISGKRIMKNCTYTSIYFLGKSSKTTVNIKDENIVITANINRYKRQNTISSSMQEYGNTSPIKLKYPNLAKNEAVLEYIMDGDLQFIKLSLEKKESMDLE